jgi:alkylation response protein AidB-like acyl-CoA dehydrogenase
MFDQIPTGLSEEQRATRAAVREMARKVLAPMVADIDRRDVFPDQAVAAMDGLGLFALSVPEEFGGAGVDTVTECLVVEELAFAFPAAALTICPSIVLAHVLRAAGPSAAQEKYFRRMCEPQTLAGICLTEPGSGSDSASITTRAEKVPGGYLLNGTKIWVTNGSVAALYCVFARTGSVADRARGISAFMVDAETPGLRVGRIEEKMGLHGNMTAEMILEDVFVPDDQLIGVPGKGFSYVMKSFDLSRPVIGVLALGIARSALDAAATFASKREQFGQPVNQFQGVQFMLADMALGIESARALVYETARVADTSVTEMSALAAMAKTYATDVAMQVTTDAVQVLGGNGYMRDFAVERMMRDAKVFQIFEGTNQIQRVIIARHINSVIAGRS